MRASTELLSDRRSSYDRQRALVEGHPRRAEPREPISETTSHHHSVCIAIMGNCFGLHRVFEEIELVAPTEASVIITGETGVGKELVARAIHERSPRRSRPMIKVNCTAIPHELFESEFFGHVKGAFSGAGRDRVGRFQLADGGTLFLDEIGDLPASMQPKLLRVLQEGEFEVVGDERTRRADVRIIAASNYNLKQAVDAGKFREDLYYRLSVFPIEVPPLRERKEDIPILTKHFFESACGRYHRAGLALNAGLLQQLRDYDWPGNVRELRNIIERAVITARFGELHLDITEGAAPHAETAAREVASSDVITIVTDEEMKRRERANIAAALKRTRGRVYGTGGAAELLGMKPSTLNARIKKLGLRKPSAPST